MTRPIFRQIILFDITSPSDRDLYWKSRNAIKLQIRIPMYNNRIFDDRRNLSIKREYVITDESWI